LGVYRCASLANAHVCRLVVMIVHRLTAVAAQLGIALHLAGAENGRC
jgi:hypothetical protein